MAFTKCFIVLVLTTVLCCVYCCGATTEEKTQQAPSTKPNDAETDQLDQETIMMMCNETFRTPMGLSKRISF